MSDPAPVIEVVETGAGFAGLEPEWKRLYSDSRCGNPFLSWEWTAACRRHSPYGRPFVITARRQGELVGLAALALNRSWGFRVLRFIGDGRSDYLGFLSAGDEADMEAALLRGLRAHRDHWDLAVLRALTDDRTRLHQIRPPDGIQAHSTEGTTAPYLAFDGDWAALQASGPGWLKRMAKASRKWIKEGGTVERLTGPEAAARVHDVATVEAASWKGRDRVARFQPGSGQELLRETLGALTGRGEMELWLAYMDGRPAAFQVNFLAGARLWLYQGAYDEQFRKFSPGGVVDFQSIQAAWMEGRREYDFMSGDEPYKAERTDRSRAISYLALYPDTAAGRLAFGLLIAPRWRLKGWSYARAAHRLWLRIRAAAPLPAAAERGR